MAEPFAYHHYENTPPPTIGDVLLLHLVLEKESDPLKDPQRHPFYNLLNLCSSWERIKFLNVFRTNNAPFRTDVEQTVYPNMYSIAGPTVKRSLDTIFKGYIVEEQSGDTRNRSKRLFLTPLGEKAKVAAQIAQDFFSRPDIKAVSPTVILGMDIGQEIPPAAIRSEILITLALSKDHDIKQGDIIDAIKRSPSGIKDILKLFRENKIIEANMHHSLHLTQLGETILRELILPIAQLDTGYPTDILRLAAQNVMHQEALLPQSEATHDKTLQEDKPVQTGKTLKIQQDPANEDTALREAPAWDLLAVIHDGAKTAKQREKAWEGLIEMYGPLIGACINRFHERYLSLSPTADPEQLRSFAREGLLGAALHSDEVEVSFSLYAKGWITNTLRTYALQLAREFRRGREEIEISLEEMAEESDGQFDRTELPILTDDSLNPAVILSIEEDMNLFRRKLLEMGLVREQVDMLLEHFVGGYSQREVAELHGVGTATASRRITSAVDVLTAAKKNS